MEIPPLKIAGFSIRSRLFVGTGKYLRGGEPDYELMRDALAASGCEVVTVAVRRERLYDKQGRSLLDFLDAERSYRSTQLAYRQALAAYMLSLEQLRLAVGTRSLP